MQNALLAGLLAAVACGVMGTYVVVKRIGYITGGIAHSVLGGMGAAYYFGFHPIYGAIAAALVAAVLIGLVSLRAKQHEDTLISALWAVGMASGVILISRTPGYNADLMSYLFGNILMVSGSDILFILVLDLIILALVFLLFKRFQAVCFDEENAKLQGVKTEFLYLLLLCLIALTVVILVQVVGLILVIALITLPASVARHYTIKLRSMMIFAVLLGIVLTSGGIAVSYTPDLPAGATIVVITGILYLFSVLTHKKLLKIVRRSRKNSV
jgi:zinc transport system permease protein